MTFFLQLNIFRLICLCFACLVTMEIDLVHKVNIIHTDIIHTDIIHSLGVWLLLRGGITCQRQHRNDTYPLFKAVSPR